MGRAEVIAAAAERWFRGELTDRELEIAVGSAPPPGLVPSATSEAAAWQAGALAVAVELEAKAEAEMEKARRFRRRGEYSDRALAHEDAARFRTAAAIARVVAETGDHRG